MSNTPSSENPAPTSGQTISLNDIADRYLAVYQRLFDITMMNLASYRKVSEEDYDMVTNQFPVQPQQNQRRDFEAAKDAAQLWLARNLISEALSTVVPLMEDCRTVLSLCDYKAAGKNDPARIQEITGPERQAFMSSPIGDKFKFLKEKFETSSEIEEHILSLMDITKGMVMHDGKAAPEICTDGKLTLKIRTMTLTQAPVTSDSGQPVMGLTRQMNDHSRVYNEGEVIDLNKAEIVGSIVTVSAFLATLLASVQTYAKKVGAADDASA
ncbi:MAG: hypothetical protein AAF558_07455 [Verrucomicrobiota bacterium]